MGTSEKHVVSTAEQDICVAESSAAATGMTGTESDKMRAAYALFGILPSNAELYSARDERLKV